MTTSGGSANFVLYERSLDDQTELLALEGVTTPASAARLKTRLADMHKRKSPRIIVDLSRTSFVDSSVVDALAHSAREAKRSSAHFVIVEPVDPLTARPLEIGRLDLVADVAPTLTEAAKRVGMPAQAMGPPGRPPPPPLAGPTRRRKTGDQDIMQELAQLRRFAQELRRESGMHEEIQPGEIERRMEAERAFVRGREDEALAAAEMGDTDAADTAVRLAAARAQLEEARRGTEVAIAEADRMEEEAEAAHARIQALEGEMERMRDREAAGRREAGDIQHLRSELAEARAETAAARQEAESAEAEAETAHARAQDLEREIETASAEAAELRAQLEQARSAASVAAAEGEGDAATLAAEETRQVDADDARLAAERARLAAEEAQKAAGEERARADAQERQRADEAGRREREAEEARRRAEEERRRAEEAARPRPKVPVWADPAPINLNTADVEELMLLPGIGLRPAQRIVSFREERGSFASFEDVMQTPDVPRERLAKIRPYVRV